jgi:hypothetical protein
MYVGQDSLTPQCLSTTSQVISTNMVEQLCSYLYLLCLIIKRQKESSLIGWAAAEILQKWRLQIADYITRRAISKWVFAKNIVMGLALESCTEFVKKVGWAIMQ